MPQTQSQMASLYDRLSQIGFPKTFVRQLALPDWWDDEFEEMPGSEIEAAAYISRRLNLDIDSLLQPDRVPSFKRSCHAKFKTKPDTKNEQLFLSQCMSSRIAEMVAYACIPEYKYLPTSAQEIRKEILTQAYKNGEKSKKFIDLEGLLEWCWSRGIPVVHFSKLPKNRGVHKFQGMVTYFGDRPVIVLSLKSFLTARLLFLLAHELGHLVKGHIQDTPIIDEEIEPTNEDSEEVEANEFAVELLMGKSSIVYYSRQYISGEQLANEAWVISERDLIDPGVIILNFAWMKAKLSSNSKQKEIAWATATKALKILEGVKDASRIINKFLQSHLNWKKLDNDSQEYLSIAIEG